MNKDIPGILKSARRRFLTGRHKDRERVAAYHYARLLGAGHDKLTAARQAAVLIPVSTNEFLLGVWPRFRYRAGIKAAMESTRKGPGDYPFD